MEIYNLGNRRMLCWDEFLIDKKDNARVKMHKPAKTADKIICDDNWDGAMSGYARFMKQKDGKYYFYYRAQNITYNENGDMICEPNAFCLKVSNDGKNWKNMPINKHQFGSSKINNLFFPERRDNFSVFYDENPDCPKEEKFKALSMGGYPQDEGPHGLYLFVSENGIDFTRKGRLPIPGSFDSYNVMLWDKEAKLYRFFYRSEYHTEGFEIEFDVVKKERTIFRTINTSTSKDLINFEHHGEIKYINDDYPVQFYTNQIEKYYRANDMFIGIPTRYYDHWDNTKNFEHFPLAEVKKKVIEKHGRAGSVITDCSLLTSRDGFNFNKWNEAFLTPGIESRNNWWYGECYTAYGLEEVESDIDGAPNELSFYMNDTNFDKSTHFDRYALRIDGFFSWYANFGGGEILTKPFTFEGSELELNFATSGLSYMTVSVCDENGNEIEGYNTYKMFGNSLNRKVDFEKPLKDLEGKPIRLKFFLRDCDLYSFKFN